MHLRMVGENHAMVYSFSPSDLTLVSALGDTVSQGAIGLLCETQEDDEDRVVSRKISNRGRAA